MSKILIIGCGGHGKAVVEALTLQNKFQLIGFIDDNSHKQDHVNGIPILGGTATLEKYRTSADYIFVAIGKNNIRESLCQRALDLGFELASIIHPTAIISPSATYGPGTAIMAGAIIGTEAKLGMGVIINCGAIVDHHCNVADFGHLGVNTCMAGGAELGERSWLQAGSSLGYGVRIVSDQILPPNTGISSSS